MSRSARERGLVSFTEGTEGASARAGAGSVPPPRPEETGSKHEVRTALRALRLPTRCGARRPRAKGNGVLPNSPSSTPNTCGSTRALHTWHMAHSHTRTYTHAHTLTRMYRHMCTHMHTGTCTHLRSHTCAHGLHSARSEAGVPCTVAFHWPIKGRSTQGGPCTHSPTSLCHTDAHRLPSSGAAPALPFSSPRPSGKQAQCTCSLAPRFCFEQNEILNKLTN